MEGNFFFFFAFWIGVPGADIVGPNAKRLKSVSTVYMHIKGSSDMRY